MNNSLLSTLQSYYEEDPDDPFNIYALAIEYMKSDAVQAEFYFDILLKNHEGYLATYYQAASFFAEREAVKKAEATYQKGIELAREQKNNKTLQELQRAYNNFLDDLED